GPYPDLPLGRQSRVEPDYRDGRRRDRLPAQPERRSARPAVLPLLRPGRHALAASSDQGVDRQEQRHALDKGWNQLRETIFANQKRLGVIPAGAQLTPWPDELPGKLPRWDTLTDEQKKLYIKEADVFAAYVAYTDHEIGRVIEEVERQG